MPNFEVQISTPVQLEGVKELAEQLERDIGKAKALGEATDDLEEKLKKARSNIEQAAPEAKKLDVSHRELSESVRATARAFGGLGEVGLLLSGPTAAVYLLTQGVEKLREHFAKLLEIATENAKVIREFDASGLEATAAAARATADAMEDYLRDQSEAISGEAALAAAAQAASSQRLAEIDAQIEATKKLNEAEEKLAEAEIDRAVATGQISQEEGERRKHLAQEHLADVNSQNDLDKERARIAEKEKSLADARAVLPREKAEQAALVSGSESTLAEKKRLEAQAEGAKAKAKAAQDAYDKHAGDAAAYASGQSASGMAAMAFLKPSDFQTSIRKNTEALNAEKKYVDLLNARNDHIQQMIEGDAKAAELSKKHADALEAQIKADQKLIQDAPGEIESEKRILETHRQTSAEEQRIGATTHRTQEAADIAKAAAKARQEAAHGHGAMTPEIQREMQAEADRGIQDSAAHETGPQSGLDAADAVAKARTIMANMAGMGRGQASPDQLGQLHGLLDQMMGFLENHSSNVQSQHGSLQSTVSQVEQRLSALETRIALDRQY